MIIGKALNWKDLRLPIASAIEPLKRHPTKAPPKHVLTTSPAQIHQFIYRVYSRK